jgi:hypothetical protein
MAALLEVPFGQAFSIDETTIVSPSPAAIQTYTVPTAPDWETIWIPATTSKVDKWEKPRRPTTREKDRLRRIQNKRDRARARRKNAKR